MLQIRSYQLGDWEAIRQIHDSARMIELRYAELEDAFLPLEIAAEREDLFDYPGLFVAEQDGEVAGFAACNEEELAWLYVAPEKHRQGIGRVLARYALKMFPDISSVEVLKGNLPARALYESIGFRFEKTVRGRMPGNETFPVEVYLLIR